MSEITKQAAAEALRTAAFRVDDLDSEDYGRVLIHCMGSFTGADWDLDDALGLLSKAQRVGWVDHLFDHDLLIVDADGRRWHFNAKRPWGELS